MALHLPYSNPDPFWPFAAGIYHTGPEAEPWNPECHHYACYVDWYPGFLILSNHIECASLEDCIITAHTLASMPQISGQTCATCRPGMFNGLYFRWNLYRGENKLIVPVTEYWGLIPPLPE